MKVTALSGGVGGAKMLVGLRQALAAGDLTAVVNTADDDVIYGVHVSPDIDIVTYWLAGVADTERGWGLRGDTFNVVDAIAHLGGEAWFRLGDRDFATCIERTRLLARGERLTSITAGIAGALGVRERILPMSDDPVQTRVVCADGRELSFQDYFVRERCEPEVSGLLFSGIAEARPTPEVLDALESSDIIVVCPSNPLVSIGPILALPGVRDRLRAHARVVAISPIIGGAALKGPAATMLVSTGSRSSAAGVAELYTDFCDIFLIDPSDANEVEDIEKLGLQVSMFPSVISGRPESEALARHVMGL